MNNEQIIGFNLKKIRKERGMTQKEFAELIDMGVQNLSQSERGVYKPGLDKIISIAEKLEITPNDLLLDSKSIAYFKGARESTRETVSSMIVQMETWEPYRAKAEMARRKGKQEEEKDILIELVHQLAWTNEHWREIADFVYYKKLDTLVKKASQQYSDLYTNPSFFERVKNLSNPFM